MENDKPKIFSIEGNIGAGKSTLLDLLKSRIPNCDVISEPVELWKNVNGYNLLERFYTNPKRWGFSFELYVMLTKLIAVKKALNTKAKYIFVERSLYTDMAFICTSKMFGKMLLSEFFMLKNFYNFFLDLYPKLNGVIYLDTKEDICLSRIKKRARKGEEKIDKGYLCFLNVEMEKIDYECEKLTVNGNFKTDDADELIKEIECFIYTQS